MSMTNTVLALTLLWPPVSLGSPWLVKAKTQPQVPIAVDTSGVVETAPSEAQTLERIDKGDSTNQAPRQNRDAIRNKLAELEREIDEFAAAFDASHNQELEASELALETAPSQNSVHEVKPLTRREAKTIIASGMQEAMPHLDNEITMASRRAFVKVDGRQVPSRVRESLLQEVVTKTVEDEVGKKNGLVQEYLAAAKAKVKRGDMSANAFVIAVVMLFLLMVLVSFLLGMLKSGGSAAGSSTDAQDAPINRSTIECLMQSLTPAAQSARQQELGHDIQNALITQERQRLIMYCDEAEAEHIPLPYTKDQYLRQLDNAMDRNEFINQTNERQRVNWSINVWNMDSDQFEICTMRECHVRDMFLSSHAEMIFAAIAQQELDTADSDIEDSLADQRHPFVSVPEFEHKRLMDNMINMASSLNGDAFLQFAAGVPCQQIKFVCAMTFEKINNTTSNQKFRLLMIREDFLRHVLKKDAAKVHAVPYFQYRWKTLQQLHRIYFKKDTSMLDLTGEGSLMITNPGKPLKFAVPTASLSSLSALPEWTKDAESREAA